MTAAMRLNSVPEPPDLAPVTALPNANRQSKVKTGIVIKRGKLKIVYLNSSLL